jgi:alpha/beta superfamily hydrolase
MADQFVNLGFHVLRFDFYGLGDSEGELQEEMLADLYGSIQVGRYVADTQSAMNWLQNEFDLHEFVLGGLCGGAITGLLAGKNDARVLGLLALGIPVILDSTNIDKRQFLTDGQINRLGQGYMKRLFNVKSWLRLLTFQSDYKLIWKIVKKRFFKRKNTTTTNSDNSEYNAPDNTNPLFASSFFEMTSRGGKLIFIFSGADRLDWEYEEKFARKHQDSIKGLGKNAFSLHTIPNANHILSRKEWQDEMMQLSNKWLLNNIAADRA